ncbi:hypothetical protein DSO57_1011430 [Entomophthora muscae]|uniref:Uncharacterized protein n=1 Tax=Entomophthora muscae TaxID=34485 RepID=A0ACC2US28_9FUNG|nr:hypothetical protein DSO57_1011430 [Entomophthora muscae]
MHPVIGLLRYIPYNLILNRIISGRWGPASGTLSLVLPNANFMPANFVAPPPIIEMENCVTSQCPEFYAEDALMLSQVIYLGLLWLGLIVLLNPGITTGNFTKRYLKPRWWLIINSMWIWVVISHHLETASYYPVISVTPPSHNLQDLYRDQDVNSITMIQVPSSNPLLFATQTGNKLLTYPFCFCRYQGTALFDTGADQSLVNKKFADLMKLPTTQSNIKRVIMAANQSTPVTQEAKPLRTQIGDIQTTLSGPIIPIPKYDVLLGLD